MTRLLGTVPVPVERRAVGSYVDGEYVKGTVSTLRVIMSVQPMSTRERLLLPEGQRTAARFKAYLTTAQPALKTIGGLAVADRVTWAGRCYHVTGVNPWIDHRSGITHQKLTLSEPGEPDGL